MTIWDGYADQPEDEREAQHAWETEGDLPFIEEDWPENLAGPEYWLYLGMMDEDDEDGA